MNGESLNIKQDNLDKLRMLFPDIFSEKKIDIEKFNAAFTDNINFNNERYVLNWAGKADAFKVLQIPTTATLKPMPDESINFDTTQNVFIEGENLEVLKILQKSYYGKVKVICIDPPYNTGNDSFIYPDSFKESKAEYEKRIGDKDEEGLLMKEGLFRKNSKDSGHYHSNWLSMMYPRLFLAKNLLKDDGVIFVHIDDNEVHNLRLLMNEIFGEENFVAEIVVRRSSEIASNFTISKHEYCICYSKKYTELKVDQTEKYTVSRGTVGNKEQSMPIINFPAGLSCYNIPDGIYKETRKINNSLENIENLDIIEIENGKLKRDVRLKAKWRSSNDMRNFFANNCKPTKAKISGEIVEIYFENDRFNPQIKKKTFEKIETLITDVVRGSKDLEGLQLNGLFDFPKSTTLIKKFIKNSDKNDIILDFFGGSGTTAQAVLEQNKEDGGNRKFILVQLPEICDEKSEAYKAGYKTIAEISKERIRRVIRKLEIENEELKRKKESELQLSNKEQELSADLGFKVFKLSSSNFKIWRGDEITEENLVSQLDVFTNPVKAESKAENMLYELMLKSGYELTDKVETVIASEAKQSLYYKIKEGELVIVLEEINHNIIDSIIASQPKKVISLDNLFTGNDQLKTNTVLQMKDAGIDFKTI